MKTHANKKKLDVQFAVGDKVFLKLPPYIQSSLARRANQKLVFKFFGPYEIIAKIGSAAYELALPRGSAVHPVFHVSQLKKMVSPSQIVAATLPDSSVVMHQIREAVLGSRMIKHGDTEVTQVLVKWSHMDSKLATWDNLEDLQQQFPMPLVGDKLAVKVGGRGVLAPLQSARRQPGHFTHASQVLELTGQSRPTEEVCIRPRAVEAVTKCVWLKNPARRR
jgi:hypothetical protein